MKILPWVVVLGLGAASARADEYYLSPSGSNGNSGLGASRPWKTFAHAVPRLRPGDRLRLLDGTYTLGGTGLLYLSNRSGREGAPIVIEAVNERKAFIQGDGRTTPVIVNGCSWIVLRGLRVENRDTSAYKGSNAGVVRIANSHHVELRRSLCRKPNRYGNNTVVSLSSGSHHIRVVDNELYDFHRNGLSVFGTTTAYNVIRRNYVNARDYYRGASYSWGGYQHDDGIVMYGGAHNVIENNVAEKCGMGYATWGRGNRFYGNITLRNNYGGFAVSRHTSHFDEFAHDNFFRDNLAFKVNGNGFLHRSSVNVTVENYTGVGCAERGFLSDNERDRRNDRHYPDSVAPSVLVRNSLVVGSGREGYEVHDTAQFRYRRFRYSHGWNNGRGTWGDGTSGTNADRSAVRAQCPPSKSGNVDPRLGPTPVYVRGSSPMKGAGENGADVGANILYRTYGGSRSTTPLWNPETARFNRGALVRGVNDLAGSSAFDVHTRLGVRPSTLPSGYGR